MLTRYEFLSTYLRARLGDQRGALTLGELAIVLILIAALAVGSVVLMNTGPQYDR